VFVDEKLNMNRQSMLTVQKADHVLGCIKSSMSSRLREGILHPLLCFGETPPGLLCPTLEPSAQERHRPVVVGPEAGHKDYQRAEKVGTVQPGEEKALGRPYSSFPVPERACKKAGEGHFSRA